jgi:acetyl-CoA acetyltransferase
LEAEGALRPHTLAHCDEEQKKIAERIHERVVRNMYAGLRDNEVVFAVL